MSRETKSLYEGLIGNFNIDFGIFTLDCQLGLNGICEKRYKKGRVIYPALGRLLLELDVKCLFELLELAFEGANLGGHVKTTLHVFKPCGYHLSQLFHVFFCSQLGDLLVEMFFGEFHRNAKLMVKEA